jgi:hypothetical protein
MLDHHCYHEVLRNTDVRIRNEVHHRHVEYQHFYIVVDILTGFTRLERLSLSIKVVLETSIDHTNNLHAHTYILNSLEIFHILKIESFAYS